MNKQDATQGQFLQRVWKKNPKKLKIWIWAQVKNHTYPNRISDMWNANSLVNDLNPGRRVYFLGA